MVCAFKRWIHAANPHPPHVRVYHKNKRTTKRKESPMTAPMIAGLTSAEQAVFAALWKRIETKATKNELLNAYYDGHRVFQDLGISIPPQMARVHAAIGWPAKAVSTLARKHVFEGYSLDGRP